MAQSRHDCMDITLTPAETEEIFSPFEKEGRSTLFRAQYETNSEYEGHPFEVLRRASEADDIDPECLPQWVIDVDGYVVFAFPEEIIPSIILENRSDLSASDVESEPFPVFDDDSTGFEPVHIVLDYAEVRVPRIHAFLKKEDAVALFSSLVRRGFKNFEAELPEYDELRDGDGRTLAECLESGWFYDDTDFHDVRLIDVPACGSFRKPSEVSVILDDGGCAPYVYRVLCGKGRGKEEFQNLVDFYLKGDEAHDGSYRTKDECIKDGALFVERESYRDSCYKTAPREPLGLPRG